MYLTIRLSWRGERYPKHVIGLICRRGWFAEPRPELFQLVYQLVLIFQLVFQPVLNLQNLVVNKLGTRV